MTNLFLEETLEALAAKGLKRHLRLVEGPQDRLITIDGKEVRNFTSNNYLGLANDRRLKQAAIDGLQTEGVGAGASRLICGNMSAHRRLEKKLAEFKGTEDCLIFGSGYMANVGIISSLFDSEDLILCDRLNHASIIDGILLSRADFKRFPHKDMIVLEEMLKESPSYQKRVIITDSVFSMDGDIAPLDKIVALARRYNALVMIDEAHAVGVLGVSGKGLAEHLGLSSSIDIPMGTLSKAVGCFGAYVCGSSQLIDYLLNKARSFIYTTAIPPSLAAASLKAIEIIEQEPQLRERLWQNTRYMKTELDRLGFDTMDSVTPIIPILVREEQLAVRFSQRLYDQGVLAAAIRPPTVPPRTSRLRLSLMATHTPEDLDLTLEQLKSAGQELCLI